jgi:hypothetical protein
LMMGPPYLILIAKEVVMTAIKKKQVCNCENCGNEAEMVVTCELPETGNGPLAEDRPEVHRHQRVKGRGTCSQCGNEADMWVDLE